VASSTCVACSAQAYTGTVYNDSEHTCSKNPHNSNVSTLHPCTGAITSRHSHYVEGELTNLDFPSETDTDPQSHSISGPGSTASAYTFDVYQTDAGTTAIYPDAGTGSKDAFAYLALKLNGEAGEVGEAYAKYLRGDYDIVECKRRILKEIGDCIWYLSQITSELNEPFGEVAAANIRKLADRKSRNVIHGSGDDR
jgi:NTP pyrophosphatase (non-canonical NTP hydrolase)